MLNLVLREFLPNPKSLKNFPDIQEMLVFGSRRLQIIRNKNMINLTGLICGDYFSHSRQQFRGIINDQLVLQIIGTLSLLFSKCEGVS